ncbi:MAG: hypothetical protein ACYSWU_03630 [Planctomycetota bacterium]
MSHLVASDWLRVEWRRTIIHECHGAGTVRIHLILPWMGRPTTSPVKVVTDCVCDEPAKVGLVACAGRATGVDD